MLGNKSKTKHYRSGGTRGGAARFDWNDVKSDVDRQNYLGHSEMAPVGRWQKGKDILWYTRGTEEQQRVVDEEKARARENDLALIDEALGLKPKRQKTYDEDIDQNELKSLLSKKGVERGSIDVERVQGLGAAPAKHHEHIERFSAIEKQIMDLKGIGEKPIVAAPSSSSSHGYSRDQNMRYGAGDRDDRSKEDKDRKKAEKKERKREKKEHKREKKEHKKEKKRERERERVPMYETY